MRRRNLTDHVDICTTTDLAPGTIRGDHERSAE